MSANPLPGTRSRRLPYLPIVITILVLMFLSAASFFGCAKALSYSGEDRLWVGVFFWSFLVCGAGCLGAVIWLIVAFFVNLARRAQERP
jgi:hypothetical protein